MADLQAGRRLSTMMPVRGPTRGQTE